MVSRLIGIPILLGATACASASTSATRAQLTPQNGPKARVTASYHGGLTARTVRTSFRTDKNAHVIVGRLGGDGRIEILYPDTPQASTQVRGGKSYNTRSFSTNYDGLPQMYSFASRAPRSYGARVDSYDGRGNGFIFIIATQYPMFTDVLDDHGYWADSLEVEDYYSSYDPRYAIRDLADELTRGMPYSLDYADSFSSAAFTSYADMAFDCSVMGGFGFDYEPGGRFRNAGWMPAYGWWFGSGFDSFAWYFNRPPDFFTNGYSSLSACGMGRYASSRRYGSSYWGFSAGWSPQRPGVPWGPTTITPKPEPTTPLGFSPLSRRPGFRNGGESGPAFGLGRTRIDGQRPKPTTTASSWSPPPIRGTRTTADRADRFDRASSGRASSSGSFGSTRTEGLTSSRPSTPSAAPAASPPSTPARSQPAPPPKVEASAGKPRNP
jgi:hypothetical protein